MAEPVRARRLTDQEGRRLLQIVRRGKHGEPGGQRPPACPQLPDRQPRKIVLVCVHHTR